MKKILLLLASFITTLLFATSVVTQLTYSELKPAKSIPLNKSYTSLKSKNYTLEKSKHIVPKYIVFNENTKSLNIKSKYRVKYSLGTSVESEIKWYSSDTKVATVNGKGVVTAIKPGKATITAQTINKKRARLAVTVRPRIKKISFKNQSFNIPKGGYLNLVIIYKPADSYESISWTTSNKKIATVNGKGVVRGVKTGKVTITATSKKTKKKTSHTITIDRSKYIAFTFDDGPHRTNTPRLLDAFKKNNGKATFFMIGSNIPGNETILKRMKKDGHELGNHTYSHSNLVKLSPSSIYDEINKTNQLIKNATGSNPTLFRPPYGEYNQIVLKTVPMPAILWSIDTLDWRYKDKEYVKKEILNSAYDGAIILLHDIHSTSVDGTIAALKELKNRGYEFVTVTKLYELKGITLQSGTVYR